MWFRSIRSNSTEIRRYRVSFGEVVLTDIPSWIGVVHAGNKRSEPDTSTRQIRHAPTAVNPSRSHSVGMYFPLALAACRMDCPSRALISSPSIRIDIFFCGKILLPSAQLAHIGGFDVASQAAAGCVQCLFVIESGHHLIL